MITQNSLKTSSRKKNQARKNAVEYIINYPSDVVPFEIIENKVCEECKNMSCIEYISVLSRVLKDLNINLGYDYYRSWI